MQTNGQEVEPATPCPGGDNTFEPVEARMALKHLDEYLLANGVDAVTFELLLPTKRDTDECISTIREKCRHLVIVLHRDNLVTSLGFVGRIAARCAVIKTRSRSRKSEVV